MLMVYAGVKPLQDLPVKMVTRCLAISSGKYMGAAECSVLNQHVIDHLGGFYHFPLST